MTSILNRNLPLIWKMVVFLLRYVSWTVGDEVWCKYCINLDSPLIYPSMQPHGRLILQNSSLFPTTLDSSKSSITAGRQRKRRPCWDTTAGGATTTSGNVVVRGNHAPGCGGDRHHCCRDVEQLWISFYPYWVPEKMKLLCARFTDERVPSFPVLLLHNCLLY